MKFTPQTNWRKTPLGTLAEFRNGVNFSKENFGTGIRVIGVSDFQDNVRASYDQLDEINPEGVVRKEHLLKNGDILFVRSNGNRELIGRNMYVDNVPGPVTHSAFSIRLRFTSALCHPRFYAYLFRSDLIRQSLSLFGGGTNISNLNQDILGRLEVPVPETETQERIAAILVGYDKLIENNTRRIKILEQMAQMLYREWFVNFRFPGHEKVKMVESELGLIPDNWSVSSLGEACERITDGSHWSPKTVEEGGIPMASVKDMHNWGLNLSTCRRIADSEFHTLVRSDCKPLVDDVLIAKDGSYLKHSFWVQKPVEVVILSSIAILRPNKRILPSFLSLYLQDPQIMSRMKGFVSGVAIPRIVLKDFRKFQIQLPPLPLQQQFAKFIEPMLRLCVSLTERNENLRTTRDLLLPKLVSGEIRVETFEKEALAQTV